MPRHRRSPRRAKSLATSAVVTAPIASSTSCPRSCATCTPRAGCGPRCRTRRSREPILTRSIASSRAFLREHAVKIEKAADRTTMVRPQLAGNGIHFDRGFMRRCLRRAEAELHHRQLDVTSINELMRRFCPAIYEKRPRPPQAAHRAMDDVLESLEVARHYARHVAKMQESA